MAIIMKRFDDRKLKPKLTPMMQQWQDIKKQHKEYILFFRAGDFYECFNEDAKIASEVLNITLTSRTLGEKKFPLAGVPYHAVDAYNIPALLVYYGIERDRGLASLAVTYQ